MNKIWLGIGLSFLIILTACGEGTENMSVDSNTNTEQSVDNVKGVVDSDDFDKMYSDPKSYKGYEVEFTAQVFIEPERDSDATYLQAYANPENHDQNVIISIADPSFDIKMDDYISVKGIVKDQFEGENLMGGTIVSPMVKANAIEIADYITVVSPTIKTIEANQEIDQHGFVVTVQKVEFADNQTRVYVNISNNTDDSISYYTHSTKLIVDNKQLEPEHVYESGLEEVQSDILAGVESEGIIIFPAIDIDTTSLKFHSEGYSDNYDLTIDPFVFEIEVE